MKLVTSRPLPPELESEFHALSLGLTIATAVETLVSEVADAESSHPTSPATRRTARSEIWRSCGRTFAVSCAANRWSVRWIATLCTSPSSMVR
jgi:hypothetical protein